ncbi:MAG: response regulator transcription factor, partial [Chloroflexota bacterium]
MTAPTLLDPLSERELEILAYLGEGYTNKQIASELYLAIGTVKAHCHNIYSKLDVSNRSQALLRAQELDLFAISAPSYGVSDEMVRGFPQDSDPFVGREDEKGLLDKLIQDPQARLV